MQCFLFKYHYIIQTILATLKLKISLFINDVTIMNIIYSHFVIEERDMHFLNTIPYILKIHQELILKSLTSSQGQFSVGDINCLHQYNGPLFPVILTWFTLFWSCICEMVARKCCKLWGWCSILKNSQVFLGGRGLKENFYYICSL